MANKTFLRKSIERAKRIKMNLPEVTHMSAMKMAKKFVREEDSINGKRNKK